MSQTADFHAFDQRAQAGAPMVVVFLGGSLTWGANASDPQRTSYRALTGEYLRQRYPKTSFTFVDAAIGGTGSKLGIFRLERDVLSQHPDLVFLEFTVNDAANGADPRSIVSYEGTLRTLIGQGIPVFQVYLCGKSEIQHYAPEKLLGYQQRLKLADSYQTGSGDAQEYIHQIVSSGKAQLDTLWNPYDSTHPDDSGYRLYFEAVRDGFDRAVTEKRAGVVPEKPVYSDEWHTRTRKILVDGPLPAGWTRAETYRTSMWFDGLSSRWMGDVAMCDVKDQGAVQPLKVEFTGTLVGLFGEADQDGLGCKVFIDDEPIPYKSGGHTSDIWNFSPPGSMPGRLFVWRELADNLKPGPHVLRVEPVFPEGKSKGQLRIESVCSAGE